MEIIKKYFNDEIDFQSLQYYDDMDFKKYPKHREILNSIKNKDVLSLGCGAGREVKLLVKNNNKVVAVDIAEKVIEKSKQIEPNAEYHCKDLVEYEDKRKYDYIIALSCVLNYIGNKEDRSKIADNLINMLKGDGEIILQLSSRKSNYLRVILALFNSILNFDYCFGDIYYKKINDFGEKVYPIKTHLYSIGELKDLFKGMNVKVICEAHTHLVRINHIILKCKQK